MRITQVRTLPLTQRKDDPTWRFALRASPIVEGFLVEVLTDEGLCGWGYAATAAHLGVSAGAVGAALAEYGPALSGRDPFRIAEALTALERLPGPAQARAAIDCALHDLVARALGVPVYQLLGGLVRTEVPLLRILALKEPAAMAANAVRLVEAGYRYLKIKVEGDTALDVARVRAIRDAVGPEVHLTIDANQSYSPKEAIRAIAQMEPFGIDLVEQPVRADDLEGLALVTRTVATPVEADESAGSLEEIFRLCAGRLVDRVSLKLPRLGGLRQAALAVGLCQAANIRCRLGAAVGSRLLSAAALHFAAATPYLDYACELGEFARLLDDPVRGLEVEHGILRVPEGLGLGVQVVPTETGARA
jgi:L-alanine-DL-glutamate epimerase-like enolase superfamily enzyme